jgi:3-keto-L-gulonate-6-phosphate decarboxylase
MLDRRSIVVTGGRDFSSRRDVFAALESLHREHPIGLLAQGGAKGADQWARLWALDRLNVQLVTFHASWDVHGRKAGPMRNQRMLEVIKPAVVLACPGGAGTANCVETAKRLGIRVVTLAEVLNAPL